MWHLKIFQFSLQRMHYMIELHTSSHEVSPMELKKKKKKSLCEMDLPQLPAIHVTRSSTSTGYPIAQKERV